MGQLAGLQPANIHRIEGTLSCNVKRCRSDADHQEAVKTIKRAREACNKIQKVLQEYEGRHREENKQCSSAALIKFLDTKRSQVNKEVISALKDMVQIREKSLTALPVLFLNKTDVGEMVTAYAMLAQGVKDMLQQIDDDVDGENLIAKIAVDIYSTAWISWKDVRVANEKWISGNEDYPRNFIDGIEMKLHHAALQQIFLETTELDNSDWRSVKLALREIFMENTADDFPENAAIYVLQSLISFAQDYALVLATTARECKTFADITVLSRAAMTIEQSKTAQLTDQECCARIDSFIAHSKRITVEFYGCSQLIKFNVPHSSLWDMLKYDAASRNTLLTSLDGDPELYETLVEELDKVATSAENAALKVVRDAVNDKALPRLTCRGRLLNVYTKAYDEETQGMQGRHGIIQVPANSPPIAIDDGEYEGTISEKIQGMNKTEASGSSEREAAFAAGIAQLMVHEANATIVSTGPTLPANIDSSKAQWRQHCQQTGDAEPVCDVHRDFASDVHDFKP